jgi:hypothetical protein
MSIQNIQKPDWLDKIDVPHNLQLHPKGITLTLD